MKAAEKDHVSPEDQLALLRADYAEAPTIKAGKLKVPVRLLNATEKVTIIGQAELNLQIPDGVDPKLFKSLEVMKGVLIAGGTVDGVPRLSRRFLDLLSDSEIGHMYDEYETLCKTSNPEFRNLSGDQLMGLVNAVKKKEASPSDYFTWQLAEIGRFFLENL